MKCSNKIVFGLIIVVMAGLPLQGCCFHTSAEAFPLLVVEEQHMEITPDDYRDSICKVQFTIDVPVNGPKILVDSVLVFLNKELYHAFEIGLNQDDHKVRFDSEKKVTNNTRHLLSYYWEIYEPMLKKLDNIFYFILKLETQTESYVTYGLEYVHCGASCGSEKYYYSFDKRDGHQLKEIISHKNLSRFFEDYPEYANKEDYLWKYSPETNYDNSCYGLLEDHFSLVIIGWYNHYFSVDVPYSQIFSYLSPEAQILVERESEEEPMLPTYLPDRSEDGQVWMEVDTENNVLLGYVSAAGGPLISKLVDYEPELEIYPKRTHSIDAVDGSTVYLFIYSRGHLLYCDEALTCVIDENGIQSASLFPIEDHEDSIISCMWYDQLVAASDGFPFEEVDDNRFGIHYDRFTKRLYIPIMENHEKGSGYENCLRYTGRYEVLQFKDKEFVPTGTDGAWWLNPDLRNYKRTVSNRKTADGIEQVDLMPDGTYRHTVWKGAKTLDDLRKEPDNVSLDTNCR